MISRATALKVLGLAAGAVGAAAGGAWAAERAAIARVRRRADPDAHHDLSLRFDEAYTLPSHDRGTINVVSRGGATNPPVVFLHGVTINSHVWVKQFETLPELGFRAIAIDSRGHGDSECGTSGYTIGNLAHDLHDALEALDVRDAILVGHSMGGVAAQAYAIDYPDTLRERVRGVVLLSSLARAGLTEVQWLHASARALSGWTPEFGSLLARRDLGFALTRIGFGREPRASHVELTRRMLAACPVATSRGALGSLVGFDLTPWLPQIEVPALVVQGTADLLTPPADGRRMAKLIPRARLVMVRGAGHMIMLEEPEQLEELIVEFAVEVGSAPGRDEWTAVGGGGT